MIEYSLSCRLFRADRQVVESRYYQYDYRNWKKPTRRRILFQYTLAGEGRIELPGDEGRSRVLRPGLGFLIHLPGPVRYYYPGGNEPWSFLYASFLVEEPVEWVEALCAEHGPLIDTAPDSPLVEFIHNCAAALQNRRHSLDKYLRAAFGQRFILELYRHAAGDAEREKSSLALNKATAAVKENLRHGVTVARLCEAAGVSHTTLLKMFREQVGLTPTQYVMEQRIDRARNLLLTTDQSVREIAQRCGFRSDNYFCRAFRKQVGMSPGAFRSNGVPDF